MISPPSLYEIARMVCMQVLLEEHHAKHRIGHTEIDENDDAILVETLGTEDDSNDYEDINDIQFKSSSGECIVVNNELLDMVFEDNDVSIKEMGNSPKGSSDFRKEVTSVTDQQNLSDVKQEENKIGEEDVMIDEDKDIDEMGPSYPQNTNLKVETLESYQRRLSEIVVDTMNSNKQYYVTKLLETNCFTAISADILSRILKYCPSKLTDRLLLALIPPHATELHLQECESLTLSCVVQVLQKCRHIHLVNLSETTNVTCADLFVFMGLTALPITTLILEQNGLIDDKCVHMIITYLPQLTTLNVSSCSAITDNVFLLHEYNQRKKEVTRHPEADIMSGVKQYSLTSVDISGCRQLTNDAVKHLVSLAGPQLRHVDISYTSIDCIALLYLGGFSFPAVIDLILTNEVFRKDRDLRDFRNTCIELCEVYNKQYASLYDNDLQTDEEKIRSHEIHSSLREEESKVNEAQGEKVRSHRNHSSLCEDDSKVREVDDEHRRLNGNQPSLCEDKSKVSDDMDENDENKGENELTDEEDGDVSDVECDIDENEEDDESDDQADKQESFDENENEIQVSEDTSDINIESDSHTVEDVDVDNFEDCLEMLEGCLIESDSNIDGNEMDRILDLVAKDNAEFYETTEADNEEEDIDTELDNFVESLTNSLKVSQEYFSFVDEEDVTEDAITDGHEKKFSSGEEFITEAADEADEIVHQTVNPVGINTCSTNLQDVSDSFNFLECPNDVVHEIMAEPTDKSDIVCSKCGKCSEIRQKVNFQQKDVTMPGNDTLECLHLYEDSGIDVYSKETEENWSNVLMPENYDLDEIQIEINQVSCAEDCGLRLPDSPAAKEEDVARNMQGECDSENANNACMHSITECPSTTKTDLLVSVKNIELPVYEHDHYSVGLMDEGLCYADAQSCHTVNSIEDTALTRDANTKDVDKAMTSAGVDGEICNANVEFQTDSNKNMLYDPQYKELAEIPELKPHTTQFTADSYTERTIEPTAGASAENASKSDIQNVKTSESSHIKDMVHKCQFSYAEKLFKPQILTLNVTGIKFLSRQPELGQLCFEKFLQANRTLERLSVAWKGLTIEFFKRVLCHLDKLRTVELVECTMLQSPGVAALGRCCTQLQTVNLRGVVFITDSALVPYLSQQNLSRLLIAESQNITDRILGLISCRLADTLTHLDLSWCEDISEKGINNICMKCSNLKCLYLKKCPISDTTLQLLADNARDIEELSVEVSDLKEDVLTDSGLIVLSENLTKLRVLDISWNLSVTDIGLYAILKNCALLEEANLRGLKQITIEPFLPMIEGYRVLMSSSLMNVELLPQRSRVFAPNLRVLDLDYSDLVNDQLLQMIVNVCRGSLNVTDYYGTKMVPDSE